MSCNASFLLNRSVVGNGKYGFGVVVRVCFFSSFAEFPLALVSIVLVFSAKINSARERFMTNNVIINEVIMKKAGPINKITG